MIVPCTHAKEGGLPTLGGCHSESCIPVNTVSHTLFTSEKGIPVGNIVSPHTHMYIYIYICVCGVIQYSYIHIYIYNFIIIYYNYNFIIIYYNYKIIIII